MGRTPVFVAAAWGHREVVGYLIQEGADINIADGVSRNIVVLMFFSAALIEGRIEINRNEK